MNASLFLFTLSKVFHSLYCNVKCIISFCTIPESPESISQYDSFLVFC